MFRRPLIPLWGVFIFVALVCPGNTGESGDDNAKVALHDRVFLEREGYSIRPPAGWEVGERVKGELSFRTQNFQGSERGLIAIQSYGANSKSREATVKQISKMHLEKGNQVISSSDFQTESGMKGTKLKVRSADGEQFYFMYIAEDFVRQTFGAVGSSTTEGQKKLEPVFDRVVSTLCALEGAGEAPAQLGAERYIDKDRHMAIQLPSGWDKRHNAKVVFGPRTVAKGYELVVNSHDSRVPLGEFVKAYEHAADQISIAPIERSDFKSTAGAKGVRLQWTAKNDTGDSVGTFHYFFDGVEGQKIELLWCVPSGKEGYYEKIIGESVRSLEVLK